MLSITRELRRCALVGIVLATGALAGCASNCNLLSTNNSFACYVPIVALAVVSAPVMVPYVLVQNAVEEHQEERATKLLRSAVEKGDQAASEKCLFTCRSSSLDSIENPWRRLAADVVIKEYAGRSELSAKQQALLFAARKVLADALWKESPRERFDNLNEVIRLGQSESLWEYVRNENNDLPVNGGYFQSAAQDAIIDVLMLRYEDKVRMAEQVNIPFQCEFVSFGQLVKLSSSLPESYLCKAAEKTWRDLQQFKPAASSKER